MKILLDHCLPRRLARAFPSHTIKTTADQRWETFRNGKLLAAASTEFEVFLTIDKNLKHEQNMAALPIAVPVIMAKSNRLADLLPFVAAVEKELARMQPKTLVEVLLP